MVAVLHGAGHGINIRKVQPRRNALRVHVERECDDIYIAGALAIAKQTAFHAVSPGHDAELSRRHAGATVIVRVQTQDHAVAARQVAVHPLDLVGINIRRGDLDCGREVEDDFVGGCSTPLGRDRVADLAGELKFSAGKYLGAVLQDPLGFRLLGGEPFDGTHGRHSQLFDLGFTHAKHDFTENWRSSVVHVNDGAAGTAQGFNGALNERIARLRERLNGHILGHMAALNQNAHKVKIGLRGTGETHLNLLEPHLAQGAKHAHLALGVHRLKQRLVAVPQVGAHPDRCGSDGPAGPLPIGQVDGWEGAVFGGRMGQHGENLLLAAGTVLSYLYLRLTAQAEDCEYLLDLIYFKHLLSTMHEN